MAVPKKIMNKNISRMKFVEEQADSFDGRVEDIEATIFNKLMAFLNNLEVDQDGNIKRTVVNLKLVNNISKLRSIAVTDSYKRSVEAFVNKFDAVKDKADSYFKSLPENG